MSKFKFYSEGGKTILDIERVESVSVADNMTIINGHTLNLRKINIVNIEHVGTFSDCGDKTIIDGHDFDIAYDKLNIKHVEQFDIF